MHECTFICKNEKHCEEWVKHKTSLLSISWLSSPTTTTMMCWNEGKTVQQTNKQNSSNTNKQNEQTKTKQNKKTNNTLLWQKSKYPLNQKKEKASAPRTGSSPRLATSSSALQQHRHAFFLFFFFQARVTLLLNYAPCGIPVRFYPYRYTVPFGTRMGIFGITGSYRQF